MARLTLVIPCYNEARRLDDEAFLGFRLPGHELTLLLVDDGSGDETAARLRALRDAAPERIRVLELDENRGKAEAVRRGLLAALDAGAELCGFWDADLSTPLDAAAEFVGVLEQQPGVRMVFGARVKLLGRHVERRAVRHYPGRVFATLVSLMLRLPIYDTQCGAKMFRADETLRELLAEPFATRWLFDVEILARFIAAAGGPGAAAPAIYELPLRSWRDVPGSRLSPAAYLRAATTLFTIYRRYRRPLRPRTWRKRDA